MSACHNVIDEFYRENKAKQKENGKREKPCNLENKSKAKIPGSQTGKQVKQQRTPKIPKQKRPSHKKPAVCVPPRHQ